MAILAILVTLAISAISEIAITTQPQKCSRLNVFGGGWGWGGGPWPTLTEIAKIAKSSFWGLVVVLGGIGNTLPNRHEHFRRWAILAISEIATIAEIAKSPSLGALQPSLFYTFGI